MNLLKEFKDFAFKGNLIDMAVGIIIGGAFGTVMKSLVDDIFMPILGMMTGGVNFSDNFLLLGTPKAGTVINTIAEAKAANVAVLTYGNFISAFISFLLVALAIFIVIIKVVGTLTKGKPAPAPAAAPEPTTEEKMLEVLKQIRDKKS
jgi:large conductance mechanosensitive channel